MLNIKVAKFVIFSSLLSSLASCQTTGSSAARGGQENGPPIQNLASYGSWEVKKRDKCWASTSSKDGASKIISVVDPDTGVKLYFGTIPENAIPSGGYVEKATMYIRSIYSGYNGGVILTKSSDFANIDLDKSNWTNSSLAGRFAYGGDTKILVQWLGPKIKNRYGSTQSGDNKWHYFNLDGYEESMNHAFRACGINFNVASLKSDYKNKEQSGGSALAALVGLAQGVATLAAPAAKAAADAGLLDQKNTPGLGNGCYDLRGDAQYACLGNGNAISSRNKNARYLVSGQCSAVSGSKFMKSLADVCYSGERGCAGISDSGARNACYSCGGRKEWAATAATGNIMQCYKG